MNPIGAPSHLLGINPVCLHQFLCVEPILKVVFCWIESRGESRHSLLAHSSRGYFFACVTLIARLAHFVGGHRNHCYEINQLVYRNNIPSVLHVSPRGWVTR